MVLCVSPGCHLGVMHVSDLLLEKSMSALGEEPGEALLASQGHSPGSVFPLLQANSP